VVSYRYYIEVAGRPRKQYKSGEKFERRYLDRRRKDIQRPSFDEQKERLENFGSRERNKEGSVDWLQQSQN